MRAVFFFAPSPTQPQMAADYLRFLSASLKINRRYFDKALLYTYESAPIPERMDIDEIIRLPSRHRHFMHYLRVVSWAHYLGSDRFDADSVFLDADVVLNRGLDEVFDNDFALAFAAMPSAKSYSCINTGVIFARKAEKQVAFAHAEKLAQVAGELRLMKEPRFPQFKSAGVWGVDEMCVYQYLDDKARARHTTLRDIVATIGFDQFSGFGEGISLFGGKFNSDYRKVDESEWNRPSALHFQGFPKSKLFEYCEKLSLSDA